MSTNKTFNKVQLDVKFTQATSRVNLISEENISISFGKISKYFADLHSQAFTGYTHPTYTARTGKPTGNQTPGFGSTFTISQITSDGTGHVTAATDRTVKIPDTTMGAASADAAGSKGLVPAPAAGKQTSFLRGDGTWVVPTNTTYSAGAHLSLSSTTFSLASYCKSITDWNSATTNGWYMGFSVTNAPSTAWWFGRVVAHNNKYCMQEVWQFTASTDGHKVPHKMRMFVNNVWGNWVDVTVGTQVPENAVFTDHITTVTSSGSGNAVTDISADANGALMVTKGSTFSLSTHTHGLLHSNLNQTATNGTTGGWSVIGIDPAVTGYVLKSIRINETSPNWLSGGYGAGIAFGGYDTKGVISMNYHLPAITFAGGNHNSSKTEPVWYFKISGTSGNTYNLANFYDSATSRTANTVLAAPNGSNGGATFRKLVAADLPSHTHSYLPLSGTTINNPNTSSVSFTNGMTGNILFTNTGNTNGVARGIGGIVGTTDSWSVRGYQTGDNKGCLEIAVGDDGDEGIYARQYTSGQYKATFSNDAGAASGLTYRELVLMAPSTGASTFPSDVTLSGGKLYLSGGAGSYGQLNLKTASYNVMFRNDNTNTYILLTAKDDPNGSWTSARPLTINNSTGVCSINGNATSATILQTARNINGVSFDGSANITIPRSIKHIHAASGTEGSAGWVKIARITVTNLYANHPMTFTIAQRGIMQYRIHLVLVNNGSVAAAAISQFIIARDNSWTDTNNNPRAYIIKPSDGIFDLYIRKTEAHDHIFVVDFTKADNSEGDNYSVAWTNVHAADSAITGGTEAVKKLYLPTTTNYAASSSVGGAATSAAKLNTNAGAADRPVYFSGGVPVRCDTPGSGSWFKGVPLIGTDGVMEVGRYFDMHSTNTGTTDWDVRLDASGVSSFRFTFNTPASSSIAPSTNNQTSLGTSSLKWSNVYATTFYGALSGNASTATRADYVNVVAGNEIRFYNDNQLKANNQFWIGYSWAAGSHYTPSGGSDTSSTTAPNITKFIMGNCSQGGLASVHAKTFILGNGSSPTLNSKTTTIATAATTTNRTITLPDASGTVALLTKGSKSFWGLMDGAGSISEWIRATSSGFIPSQAASFFQTATSSLGTNTWYFKNSYIQYMNANRLILGAAKTADGAAKGQLKFFSGNASDATGTVTLECVNDSARTGDYTVKLPTWNGTIPIFEKLFEGASNTVSLSYSDINEYDVFLITVANSNATSEQVTVTSLWISNVAGIHDMPLIWGGAPASSGGSCNVTSGWIQLSKNSGTTTFVVAHKPNVAQMTSSGWTISSPTYNLYIRKIFGLKAYKRT